MAEVKVEASCEGENIESETHTDLNGPNTVDPPLSDYSSSQEEVSKTLGEIVKASSVSLELEPKDFAGFESIIPLSPQWLVSKHGDGKPQMTPIDLPQAPAIASNGNSNDLVSKERRRTEGNRDAEKRRDWWRTMAAEGDGSVGNRRERWREDERESSLLGRRDRWKEAVDNNDRKLDRWAENSSTARESGESRRAPHSERRSDSANRETSYETRRDSKWNSRWGPEDKEKETRREKRMDLEKEGEAHREKQHPSTHRNETDREVDTPARDRWRPHSITSRNKGETPPPGSSPPPKAAPGFAIGRGRGDTTSAGFAVGRGRVNLSLLNPSHCMLSSIGSPPVIEAGDGGSGFRYPRAKLLDIYRKCSGSFSNKEYPEGFSEVPHLTQIDPFEPLAFFTPDMDEEAILEGILKGDVLTSGAVHATSKEQTSNKARENSSWNRARGRTIGNKEGVSEAMREDNFSGLAKESDTVVATRIGQDSMIESKESKDLINVAGNHEYGAFLSGFPVGEAQDSLLDLGGSSDKITEPHKKLTSWYLNKNSESEIRPRFEGKKSNSSSQIAPEELSLVYIDPQGVVQGPFGGGDIIDWLKAGFFGTDLMVRTADSPESAPFTQLIEIMPHLQGTAQVTVTSKDEMEYQENNNRATKVAFTSKHVQQPVPDFSGRHLRLGKLQADGGHFSATGSVEGRKAPEREKGAMMSNEAAMLKRASSLPQRMAPIAQIQNDEFQSAVQRWPERGSALPEKPGLISRNAGHQSSRAEFLHGAPELFSSPGGSRLLERSRSDMSPGEETLPHHLPTHGLDAFHMHQLQQLEMQRLQQLDLGHPVSHVLQQQQHLRQQQQLVEHLLSSGHLQHDRSLHSMQHLSNPRMPPRLQHQQSFPAQAAESSVDQILRLHQQQAPSPAHLEQLLRQHQQRSGVDHLHGSPMLTDRQLRRLHEALRTNNDAQPLEQLLQRHTHELLQRQQEHQARQHSLLIQQQLASLHEQHISGVWEIDEFGQFVQTQTPNPMHSPPELFQQHQPQRHQRFSPMQHLGASHVAISGGQNSQPHLSRSELRKLADLEMQKNLASLLDGTTSMPSEMLAQLQSEIARFEAQNVTLPEKGPFELHTHKSQSVQNQALSSGEGLGGPVWSTGHDFDKQQVREMHNRGVGSTSIFDQLSAKSESPVPNTNWQQDSLSLQTDVNRSKVFALNADDNLDSALRPHSRSEKLADQLVTEDLFRVLGSRSISSHSGSGQRGNSTSAPLHEQPVIPNPWIGEHNSLDNDSPSAQVLAPQPPLSEPAGSRKAKHWDMDWTKTAVSHAGELTSKEVSKTPLGLGPDFPGIVGEVRTASPALLHDGGNLMGPNERKDITQHSSLLNNDDHQNAAAFVRSGSVSEEDFGELLPSTYGHLLGDALRAREDNASSRLAVWSSDVKKQNSLKEIQDVPRNTRSELEGVVPSLQGQIQANNRVPSMASLAGTAGTLQRAPSPSVARSPTPPHHGTTIQSAISGDDEFFWDHNLSGSAHSLSMTNPHNNLFPQRQQFGKVSNEGFAHLASTAGSGHMAQSDFPSAVTRQLQKGLWGSKQTDDVPVLNPQGSLTIADAKAFREWCEEQINLRRGLNESTSECMESGPAYESLKAEFLRCKDPLPMEAIHTCLPTAGTTIGDKVVTVEAGDLDEVKKNSEGEEDLDSEPSGQSSALKNTKKKGKKAEVM